MIKKRNTLIFLALLTPFMAHGNDGVKEVDVSLLNERGMLIRVLTDGRPIWIAYRTKKAISNIEKHAHVHYTNDPATIDKRFRSYSKDYFVVFGGCPKGDELPAYYPNEGFVCQSNCASFDMAGRPSNECAGSQPMDIPVHHFRDEKTIIVPIHQDGSLNKNVNYAPTAPDAPSSRRLR